MKNKKLKGFSLAELLISLLIISIVLSAAIPTLTRRAGAGRELIWRWSQQQNNNAYFGVGSNQSAIIGADAIPLKGSALDKIFDLSDNDINITNMPFINDGDKLVLVKKPVNIEGFGVKDFANSHISFYTASNSKEDATTSDITYTGRIATGQHELAFGIGTLQSLQAVDTENTAIGHYSLLKNTIGIQNTAVGEKALAFNLQGKYNTAVGYKSLFNDGFSGDKTVSTSDDNATISEFNTAVGNESAPALQAGSNNSVLGAKALYRLAQGDDNVVVGSEGMNGSTKGSRNVAVGSQACSFVTEGDNNICIGYKSGASSQKDPEGNPVPESSSYGLFIGTSDNSMPIISGHSQKIDKKFEKELNINARTFSVKPHNGGDPTLQIESYAATNVTDFDNLEQDKAGKGYGTGKQGYRGDFRFNLLSGGQNTITLFLTGNKGTATEPYPRAVIGSYDTTKPTNANKLNLSFNDKIAFIYKEITKSDTSTNSDTSCADGDACINTLESSNTRTLGINDKLYVTKNINTPKVKMAENSINVESGNKNNYSVNFNSHVDNDHIRFDLNGTYDKKSIPILYVESGTTSTGIGPEAIFSSNNVFTIKSDALTFKALKDQVKTTSIKSPYPGQSNITVTNDSLIYIINTVWEQLNLTNSAVQDIYTKVNNLTTSDARLKDISGDNTAGLKEINALEVKNFTFKADKNKTPHVGVIAQQLQKVFPNSVFKGEDGYLRITKDEIFYAMVNSIKELFKQIQDLTAKITGLDKRITQLEKQNAQLKKQNAEFEKRLSRLERASR